jgi:pSer/pThr/pTyr-binding forkhead associated (FHA) protein
VQIFPVNQQVINLGRRIDNHVVIEDLRVSRVHAQIRAIKGHFVIFDLDSSGGTFVNGVRSAQTTLYPGDVISLAGVDLVYGQDATYLSSDDGGSTQPLVPFPGVDD